MIAHRTILKRTVAAFVCAVVISIPAFAQQSRLEDLFEQLSQEGLPNWKIIEEEIWLEWSRSGSATMDLMLKRGREAMDKGELSVAIEHFTALTDHAPEFAEGFNARATAYFRAGLYGPSLTDIRHVLSLNPRHFGALTGLGTILEQTGSHELALKAYRAAHAIHPNDPELEEAVNRLDKELAGISL